MVFGEETSVSPAQFIKRVKEKNSEALRITANLKVMFDQGIPIAVGPPGQPGNAEAIIYAASRIGETYRSVLQWKLDYLCLSVDNELAALRSIASGLCDNIVTEIEDFIRTVASELTDSLGKPPGD